MKTFLFHQLKLLPLTIFIINYLSHTVTELPPPVVVVVVAPADTAGKISALFAADVCASCVKATIHLSIQSDASVAKLWE